MDGIRLQGLVNKGYRISAQNVGLSFNQYRPVGASNPLASSNLVASNVPASFTPYGAEFQFGRPPDEGEAKFNGLFDPTNVTVFDYFVGAGGQVTGDIYFVADLAPIMPPFCIRCNRTITVTRAAPSTAVGLNPYGGSTPATEVPLMTKWPCSLLEVGHGRQGSGGELPGDVAAARWAIVLPSTPGVILHVADILVDDLGKRYLVGGAELTSYGWRVGALEMVS